MFPILEFYAVRPCLYTRFRTWTSEHRKWIRHTSSRLIRIQKVPFAQLIKNVNHVHRLQRVITPYAGAADIPRVVYRFGPFSRSLNLLHGMLSPLSFVNAPSLVRFGI